MSTEPTIEQIKPALRATWMMGDFGIIAKQVGLAGGEDFARDLQLPAGSTVLDVATGTGNVAVPLARLGCIVTGVDIAPNLLEQARARAASEGLSITFDEGDAEALPYDDASFEAVTSMFGAMFAPRPELVAAECARVLKPGGLLAMGNWNPESFTGAMFRVTAKHAPPPSCVPPAMQWGVPDIVEQRLSAAGFTEITTSIAPMEFDLPVTPTQAVHLFRDYYGPTMVAFSRLDEAGKAALEQDMIELWTAHNVAADPSTHTLVHNQYLLVTARRA